MFSSGLGAAPPAPGGAPGAPPGAPPAWYTFCIIGFQTCSSSFFLCSSSSISALSLVSTHSRVSLTAFSTFDLSSSLIFPFIFESPRVFLIPYAICSRPFFAATFLACFSSSSLNFSASLIIFSISSGLKRPLSFVMVILEDLFVDLSSAFTFKMLFASRSKVTLICGIPRGAGGMPLSSNLPKRLLSAVLARSPSKTWMRTPGWLSA
mmetsp:Transcript_8844/g.12175  ORF Transcript_8844/g.12175 Transcript_8844/m.12175 type:complete len:208 (+) Transcript_8844:259-882(+)